MAIDRSKFKTTSVAVIKQKDEETAALAGGKDKGPNADYIKFKPGVQYFRILPPHPEDGGELYAEAKGVHWLPCEVPKRDKSGNFEKNAKDEIIKEWKNRPIFNARIHGGKKKDIVEEYTSFAQKLAKNNFPTDENKQKEYLDPITGGYGSKYDGIMLKQSWVMYVLQLLFSFKEMQIDLSTLKKVFGRLEIGKAVKNRLNQISAIESANDPLGTDPFTDLEEGKAISINYNDKAEKAQDYYTTEIYTPSIKGTGGKIVLFPLSDEDLEKFETYPSLKKMFVNVYDRKTFDMAMKGLKKFDDDQEFGIFAHDEFLDICEELSEDFPETEGEANAVAEEEKGDPLDRMDRDELKEYNREHKLGIVINKSITDDQFRDMIRDTEKQKEEPKAVVKEEIIIEGKKQTFVVTEATTNDLPWEKEGFTVDQDPKEKTEAVAEEKKPAVKTSVSDRLAKLKGEKK